ncbi:MAG TPA: dipeptidase [candidate division Zixibacteria bacterium]|nr:dipeptidase [candidate division Zixibacteria bacterium]
MTTTTSGVEAALSYLQQHADEHLRGLDEFLRIESVSADPERDAEVRRAAQWIVDELTRIGVENARTHETSGHPIVTGDWLHAGPDAPTVLVYCHYDVQPADPLDEWVRPPFEPRYEDDIVYARGSGDDKGQLYMHLKAAEAWLQGAGRLPVNLRFFFEGDEEVGSLPVEQFIAQHPELLAADICVVSDTDMQDDEGTPAITYGLRGIAYWQMKVSGPFQDVHSGTYGGGVANPATVLVKLLASLTDAHGRVTVPGFYDKVRPMTEDERRAYAELPFDEAEWARSLGIPAPMDGDPDYTLLERLSARPTFDIHGLWGGYSGEGPKTIIPAWAAAKFSTRLVPDQDHREIEQLMVEHLRRIAPPSVTVEVRVIHGGQPAITPIDHPAVRMASRALEAAFGRAPMLHRSGGSIPVVAALESGIGVKSVLVGFASPNGNFHAPNEWLPLRNYRGGTEAIVRLWAELGAASPAELRGS